MDIKIRIGNSNHIVTLKSSQYKASGGEGAIYVANGMAYKMYHDPSHKQLNPRKLQELAMVQNQQVIVPQELIFDPKDGKPLGYTTRYVDNVEPLLKLFTRTFKNDNNISSQMINHLVKEMQKVVTDIHSAKCLIVDLNELNILIGIRSSNIVPWFIDTDSYSTPSFKATAIMDSVRDRRVTTFDTKGVMHYNPDEYSDWFSWAILSFWLYTNIHAFRGTHPNYKPRDKQKQMDDGISVFHPGVRVPPSVNDFKVIPARHLDWFKRVFLNNERGVPPIADSSVPLLVPTQIVTIQGTDKIEVNEIAAYSSSIITIHQIMGIYYVATKTHFYANQKEIGINNAKKVHFCSATDSTLIVAQQDINNKIIFRDLTKADPVGTATSNEMFARNNAIYTIGRGKLIENSFIAFGNKIIHQIKEVENISISAKMYDGCVIQDLLGKAYLTLPYKLGSCFSKYISVLDGYRIVEAKSDKNIVIIIAEQKGKFDEFIIIFKKDYSNFDIRKIEDVTFNTLNFAVSDNGLCLLLVDDKLELFITAQQTQVIDNPPFDASMRVFATSDGFFFQNGNSFHQIKNK